MEFHFHITGKGINDSARNRQFAEIFCASWSEKIRLTGSEPLLRKDFADIARLLGSFSCKKYPITQRTDATRSKYWALQGLGIKASEFSVLDTFEGNQNLVEMTRPYPVFQKLTGKFSFGQSRNNSSWKSKCVFDEEKMTMRS